MKDENKLHTFVKRNVYAFKTTKFFPLLLNGNTGIFFTISELTTLICYSCFVFFLRGKSPMLSQFEVRFRFFRQSSTFRLNGQVDWCYDDDNYAVLRPFIVICTLEYMYVGSFQ